MPFGGLLTVAIIGAAGAATSSYIQSRNSTSQSTSEPNLPPAAQSLQDRITQIYQDRLKQGLPPGYQEQGIAGINSAYEGAQTNENAQLTARGLGSSPVAGAVTAKLNAARAGSIGQFNAGLPMAEQNLQLENLQGAEGSLTGQRGVTGTGSTAFGGGWGNAIGAGVNSAGGMAGYINMLRQQGAFNNQPTSSFTSTTTGNLDY